MTRPGGLSRDTEIFDDGTELPVKAASGVVPKVTVPPGLQVPQTPTHRLPRLWEEETDTEGTSMTARFAASRPASARGQLTVLAGIGTGETIVLDGRTEHAIGRSRSCAVRVDDQGVSRIHCRLVRGDDGRYTVQDLGSSNGTRVNGVQVNSAILDVGDRIEIGPRVVLQFGYAADREETVQRRAPETASLRDPLTRAFNRRYFRDRLASEVAAAREGRRDLAVLLVDIDSFRSVNDVAGRAAGDAVLRRVGEEIMRCVASGDLVTRYGGEEFGVLARVDRKEAARLAERVRSRIEALAIEHGGRTIKITASVGVADLTECAARETESELLALAERRLHRAKLFGRNRWYGP